MKIKDASDVQLLVEDFGWHISDMETYEIVENLDGINNQELKQKLHQINQRLWDETFDDATGALAKLHAVTEHENFRKAIQLWKEARDAQKNV